jgi:hypothetical protein
MFCYSYCELVVLRLFVPPAGRAAAAGGAKVMSFCLAVKNFEILAQMKNFALPLLKQRPGSYTTDCHLYFYR